MIRMDAETANYIVSYYSNLLTMEEKLAVRYIHSLYKLSYESNPNLEKAYRQQGWLTDNETVLDLLRKGYDTFEIRTANRILKDNSNKVFLNNCPKCGKLARTPMAKQCRHCSHNWH